MAATYWIKLYQEVLNDYKMAILPDNVWRRCIELFLLAGEYNQAGKLPPVEEIAFRLRVEADQLKTEMQHLERVEILREAVGGGWYVAKFAERQAPVSAAERKRRQRERDNKSRYGHAPVTIRDTDTDTDTDKETDTEESVVVIKNYYEKNIGPIVPVILDNIKEAAKQYPAYWIEDAIDVSVNNDAKNWAYIKAVLKNWKTEGRNGRKKKDGVPTREDFLRGYEEVIEH